MKKLLGLLLLPLLFACGDIPATQEAEATTILGNPDPMSQACVSGYIRRAPRQCWVDNNPVGGQSLVIDNVGTVGVATCRTLAVSGFTPAMSANATFAIGDINGQVKSNLAVGIRSVSVAFFSQASCVNTAVTFDLQLREEVAVAAGTSLGLTAAQYTIPVVGGLIYYKAANLSTASTPVVTYLPNGYYD